MNISSVSCFPTGCISSDRLAVETHVAKYVGMYLDRLKWRNRIQKTVDKSMEKQCLEKAGRNKMG
jgi:hypothetical protein